MHQKFHRLKIFLPIGAYYPSQIGGPCNTLYWHSNALKNKGVNVDVVTTSLGIHRDTVVVDKPIHDELGSVYYGSTTSISFPVIKQIVKGIKSADIIHLNSLFNVISIFTFFYTKLFYGKKKIVWSVRGELNENALEFSQKKKKPLLFLYKRLTKNIIFHSTSEKETQEIHSVFGNVKVIEVPNFIEPSKRIDVKTLHQFLYLGRIHPIKAIHKMFEGFAKSQSFANSDFKLIIVGKHEERHQDYIDGLKKQIKELNLESKIEWRGHLIGMEKEKAYAESYAFILPSETENFGNVVVESLNQGTPVIASKGTPWAVLKDYNCGFHIENSPTEIATYIDKLIQLDPNTYLEMRKNAINLIDNEFDVKMQINKWIKIYEYENSK